MNNNQGWKTAFWIAGLALVLASAAAPAFAADTDYKINRELMVKLTDDADVVTPFFVVFGERANTKPARAIQDRIARAKFVADALKAVADRSQAGVRGYLNGRKIEFTPFWIENRIYIKQGTLELARALSRRPEVVAIIPEKSHPVPQPSPDAGTEAAGWNITKIKADQVWSTANGDGIIVANIDTGVQYNHPALYRQYKGWTGSGYNHTGNWYDPSKGCVWAPCDTDGHGTHTMGTMVGETADLVNRIGVAPGAQWIACRGCRSKYCWDADLLACAEWVVAPPGGVPPHIVNNSWGGGGGDAWYQSYVQSWVSAGIFPAFSIGNEGSNCNTAGSPGDYPESFASGATDSSDIIASFSSRGPSAFGGIKPDVSAPGVSVRSSVPTNAYSSYSGTSMASPHTAGLVALIWSAVPSLAGNISGTEDIITSTAFPLTTTQTCTVSGSEVPNNTYGYGRIDALAAVAKAKGAPGNNPPTVTITAPANDTTLPCPATVNLTGTASDTENGDLTGSIAWTEGSTPLGTGGTVPVTYTCSQVGAHAITARVTDAGGLSDTDTITITIYDASIPAAPTNLTASVSRTGAVTLNWTDNSNNEQGFAVERRQKTGKTYSSWLEIVRVTAATYEDRPATSGTYQYRVRAYTSSAFSGYSNTVNANVKIR